MAISQVNFDSRKSDEELPKNIMLKAAINSGNIKLLGKLLDANFEEPTANGSEVLALACKLGRVDILMRLCKDPRVSIYDLIIHVRRENKRECIEALLPAFEEYVYRQKEEKGIDVPAVLLAAIAFEQGHPEIIRRILEKGFDPFINCNCLLNQSRRHSYPDLEQLVLKAMVSAFIKNISSYFSSLWAIAEKGTLDRLDRFLAHKKIEPLFDSNASIRAAFREGLARAAEIAVDGHRRAALERLLKDKKLFNFRASDNAELLDMKEKHRNLVQYAKEHSPKMVDILSTVAL